MTDVQAAPKRAWIGWSLISGSVVALPIGWLLGFLALLPYFLGLFFFALLGLVVGAVMFRFGRPAAPAPRSTLWLIGGFVAGLLCVIGLAAEYYGLIGYRIFGHDFNDASRHLRQSFKYRVFTQEELDTLRNETRRHILAYLRAEYPPGGFIGYLGWAITDGTVKCPRIFDKATQTVTLRHRRFTWVLRVLLSLGMLTFSIMSQVLGLAEPLKPPGDAGVPTYDQPDTPTAPPPP